VGNKIAKKEKELKCLMPGFKHPISLVIINAMENKKITTEDLFVSEFFKFRYNRKGVGETGCFPVLEDRERSDRQKPKVSGEHSPRALASDYVPRMVQKGFEEMAKKQQVDELEGWAKRRFDNIDKQLQFIRKQLTGVVYRNEF